MNKRPVPCCQGFLPKGTRALRDLRGVRGAAVAETPPEVCVRGPGVLHDAVAPALVPSAPPV